MGFFSRFSLKTRQARQPPTPAPQMTRILRAIAEHNDFRTLEPVNVADHYLFSPWIHTAIARIAEAGALVPFNVYQLDGEQRIAVNNHPLERLLRAPNPIHSGFELMENTLGTLELYGNAYWYLAATEGGDPAEIWPLRPDRVRIVPGRERTIQGYVYTVDAVEIPLEPESVIHFKRWHPVDDYYGLSTLTAAALASTTDRAMARWNYGVFGKQSAIPSGIVTIKNHITDNEFDRIRREWTEFHGGGERRTAFIRGAGEITWTHIGLNQMESDFLNGRRFNRDEILHLFGVPSALLERDATRANALAARQTFLEQTIWPKLVRIAQKLSQDLAPFFGANLIVLPEEIRDREAERAELQAAQGYLTVNEVRARFFGLAPLPDGDQIVSQLPAPKPEIV
jgi:HK97 family phage portal protein